MQSSFESNIWKMYLLKFLRGLFFASGVLIPFFMNWGGITFSKIMILQSWFVLCTFLFEIPTGTIADYFGRKYSLALGCAVIAIASFVYASTPSFYIFLLAESLWAMGSALFSGADNALVYDTLKKTKQTKISKGIFGRIESFSMLGIMISAPIGSIIGFRLGLRFPMLLTSIPVAIAVFIAMTLKEPRTDRKIGSKRYTNILKKGIKFFYKNKTLKILALDMIFVSCITSSIIWMYQLMLKQVGIGLVYFGIMHAVIVIAEIIVMNNYERMENILKSKRRLVFLTSFVTGAMFILGGLITFIPLVLLSIILIGGFGLGRNPLMISYLNKYIPSVNRATILSTVSMLRAFARAAVFPIIGFSVEWSLNYTLIILGSLIVVFSLLSKVEENQLID